MQERVAGSRHKPVTVTNEQGSVRRDLSRYSEIVLLGRTANRRPTHPGLLADLAERHYLSQPALAR